MKKTVLVMGASGDIGSACVEQLAEAGWSVICHYFQHPEHILKKVEDLRLRYRTQDFFMLSLNMLDETSLPQFLSNLFNVDAIIFASGFTYYKLLPEMSSQEIEELWQIHFKTPILLLQNLQEKLAKSTVGRIVFIGSLYGETGSSMESVYSALKGAQNSFVKSYAKEVATLGITVNVVAPGAVSTQMNTGWSYDELTSLREEIPLGRLGKPSEIACAVSFLLSAQASYITGSIIDVNGGWSG